MRRMRWLMLGLLVIPGPGESAETAWEPVETGIGKAAFHAVAAHPADPNRVVAATQRAVYEPSENGEPWRQMFRAPGHSTINRVAAAAAAEPTLLVATSEGLYGSFDAGRRWQRLFRGGGDGSAVCTTVAFHPAQLARVLLGTKHGLFLSDDGGHRWRPVRVPPAAQSVTNAVFDPDAADRVYLVTERGLFVGSPATGSWEQRFGTTAPEGSEAIVIAEDAVEAEDAHAPAGYRLTAVAVDPHAPTAVYLASSKGLWQSQDAGRSWQRLPRSGLASAAIERLVLRHHSPLVIYAAAGDTLAWYAPDHERWHPMTAGLASTRIHDLAATPRELWAATDRGLFRYGLSDAPFAEQEPPTPQELLANFIYEPTIGQVRDAAIRYAEVHPSKISDWRAQARARALIPKVSVGGGTNLTDFRHWDSGSNPDALLRGERDIDWDVSVNWELADLIWSDAQTSIDVRSKLMVELRDDIVDDVTRTYFERRRLQATLVMNPPNDSQRLMEQELRVQELTALLDGWTGGFFSRQMKIPTTTQEVRHGP